MVNAAGNIFQRREISGWFKTPTTHNAVLVYTDAAMIDDGSILAISTAGQLHLLATPTGLPQNLNYAQPSAPHAVAALPDGSVLVLTAAGTLLRADFPRGPWTSVRLPPNAGPIVDIAVDPAGVVHFLDNAGVIHQAPAPGAPPPVPPAPPGTPPPVAAWNTPAWPVLAAAPPANTRRVEFLPDGSMISIDNANTPTLLPAAGGAWQPLPNVGPILSVTPLGGHTLLAIDPADNRLMTADALPEDWVPVAGPGVPVLSLAYLPSGHVAALGNNGQVYRAQLGGAPLAVGPFAPYIANLLPQPVPAPAPVTPVSLARYGRSVVVVGSDHRLYTWEPAVTSGPAQAQHPAQWTLLDTGPTRFSAVTLLDDGMTLYGIDQNQTTRLICRPDPTSTVNRTAPWQQVSVDFAASAAVMVRDGSLLEVAAANGILSRRPSVGAAAVSCGWAGACAQVIELASEPTPLTARTGKWLLQFSSGDVTGVTGDGRPWGDGTRMAARAQASENPWDAGCRVTPLIGGSAALSAMRDAFEAAILEAAASASPPGQRGYVYIADWLLTPLRDLSEDNPWGNASWTTQHQATRDQTAIGLIARMMSAGIQVRVLVWMPTTIQANKVAAHARQHWHLARMVKFLNDQMKTRGGPWANLDLGIVALDLRTPSNIAVSLHQKMCVVRVGEVNVGFCGGVDLAFTRRDFRRPANSILGQGDWQSGKLMPLIGFGWPAQNPAPIFAYPPLLPDSPDDVIEDELGQNVYGLFRHWHDQHLKLEGTIVASLEGQFDERWRVPGRPFVFNEGDVVYGGDNQVQFTSASAFNGNVIAPLTVSPCSPVGSAVAQLWRTIPWDQRRRNAHPFGRGEFTVMAGIANAVGQATQLITIWDQYFWSEPLARLLAARLRQVPTLKVLIVLPPYGSSDPSTELWYRRRALQTLWKAIDPGNRNRVVVYDLWAQQQNVGVYVHAKVQTYDDCLLVCGSANMNRRSFTLDMELDVAVLHKPDVCYHLASLAHMLTGQPWVNFGPGWLQAFWTHLTTGTPIATGTNVTQTTVLDPFYRDPAQLGTALPNNVPLTFSGFLPESIVEPTSVDLAVETAGQGDGFAGSPGAPGRLDQIVWCLEHYAGQGGDFSFRYPK